uniref:Piwi domain-containing protein n=1 Tax=Panagrolaimus superbus TaxID=310955 RepID=A0A914Z490_9BILA
MEVACFPIAINTTKPVWNYDVSVELVVGEKIVVLNKDRSDPQDKNYCRQLLRLAYDKSDSFGLNDKLKYVYDGLSCLYASAQFEDQDITVEKEIYTEQLKKAFRRDVVIRVTRTSSNHELFIHTAPDKMPLDQFSEFKRFLSLVVCQYALDCERYSVLDHGHLFSTDNQKLVQLNGGIELRLGMSKGIRLVDNGKSVQAAFEVDFRMSAFYRPVTLADAFNGFRNADEANELLKGARIHPDYDLHRSLNFVSFTKDTPLSFKFQLRDGTMTTKQRIMPKLPLVSVRPKQAGLFPAEKVSIIPHQKVRMERLGPKLADSLHSYNAVLPHIRHQNISDIIRSLNLTDQNPILKAFGISVQSNFSVIPPSKMWRPAVQMGSTVTQPKDDGSFRVNSKYLAPAAAGKWAVLYGDRGCRLDTVKILVQRLCSEAAAKGMKLPQPVVIQSVDMANFMTKAFVNIKDLTGVSYILVIDPKNASTTHHMVKLIENRYKIVTQQLDSALVDKCVERNQRMTLENILNKMNLKLGGVNWAPKFEGEA